MVLIVSESYDQSTNDVIEWLRLYKYQYVRINENDVIRIHNISINSLSVPNITFSINSMHLIDTNQISAYWFRRGFLNFFKANNVLLEFQDKTIENKIKANLRSEFDRIGEMFQFVIETKNKIGSASTADNNKLIHLSMAGKVGLNVPETIVCTSKQELKAFFGKKISGLITKAISEGFTFVDNLKHYALYTSLITEQDIQAFPEIFPPTLFQERIEKKWEIRIFFLKNKFYSMAIFSQNDDKTNVDFRRYNRGKQNYRVPFNLPIEIKRKLMHFMRLANLDCGSIDIVYSTDKKYYFLEINPVGQFGMVSLPCNYKLGKRIAQELAKQP